MDHRRCTDLFPFHFYFYTTTTSTETVVQPTTLHLTYPATLHSSIHLSNHFTLFNCTLSICDVNSPTVNCNKLASKYRFQSNQLVHFSRCCQFFNCSFSRNECRQMLNQQTACIVLQQPTIKNTAVMLKILLLLKFYNFHSYTHTKIHHMIINPSFIMMVQSGWIT